MADLISEKTDPTLIRLARIGSFASSVLALAIPTVLAAWWLLSDRSAVLSIANLPGGTEPTDWQWILAGAIALLPACLLGVALWAARDCFRAFADGAWLVRPFAHALRRLGLLLLASGLVSLVAPTLIKLILTMSNPSGTKVLAIELSSSPFLALVLGGLIRLIAEMMARAVAIAEDNAAIV